MTRDLIRHLTETGEVSEAARLTAILDAEGTLVSPVEIVAEPTIPAADEESDYRSNYTT